MSIWRGEQRDANSSNKQEKQAASCSQALSPGEQQHLMNPVGPVSHLWSRTDRPGNKQQTQDDRDHLTQKEKEMYFLS